MNLIVYIPKGCSCKNVKIGTYKNQIELKTPKFMLDLKNIGCLEFRKTTCIDKCIQSLIQELWKNKIVTLGCCCGHNKQNGYI